jgi:hypothetical protein
VVWAACGHGVELWIGAACNHDGVTVRSGDMHGADWARDGVAERGTRRSNSQVSTHRHPVHHIFGFQGFKISLVTSNVWMPVRKTKHKSITKLTT